MSAAPDSNALRRLERQVRLRLDARTAGRRVWESLPAILQIVTAVTASYSIAHWGLGHSYPILAVTVTINALGFARDARPQRVAESVTGILIGVALSDGLSLLFGKGLWQLVVVLLVVFVVGRAVSPNPAFAVAAAVPSALVVILPVPDGGVFGRTLDALIGGVIALLATALIPRDPRRTAARERRRLFSAIDEGIATVVASLSTAETGSGASTRGRARSRAPSRSPGSPPSCARGCRCCNASSVCSWRWTSPRGTCAPSPAVSSSSCATATHDPRSPNSSGSSAAASACSVRSSTTLRWPAPLARCSRTSRAASTPPRSCPTRT
jgi:hypothetical protein